MGSAELVEEMSVVIVSTVVTPSPTLAGVAPLQVKHSFSFNIFLMWSNIFGLSYKFYIFLVSSNIFLGVQIFSWMGAKIFSWSVQIFSWWCQIYFCWAETFLCPPIQPEGDPGDDDDQRGRNVDLDEVVAHWPHELNLARQTRIVSCKVRCWK